MVLTPFLRILLVDLISFISVLNSTLYRKVLQEFVRYCLNGREYEGGADYLVVFRLEHRA